MDPLAILFGSFALMLVAGVPIAYALGLASLLTMWQAGIPLALFVQQMYQGINSFVLLAVPFFLLAGILMNIGEITDRLVKMAMALFGWVRGSLAVVNVVVSMLFAGLSGSSVADVAGEGSIIIPAMIKAGYPREFSVAVTIASSTIGVIIPPSIFMVVYGAVGNVSIGALFLGGAIPGILIGLTQIVYCYVMAVRHGYPKGERLPLREIGRAVLIGLPPFGVTLIILGGITGGVFTATEAACVAVVYTLLLTGLVYRSLDLSRLFTAIKVAAHFAGPTLFCVMNGMMFGWVMAYLEVPQRIQAFARYLELGPTMTLLFIMVLFVILGTFESGVASIIIFLPVVQALSQGVGLNPVHVGVIVCVTLALGLITPPYGLCLFIGAQIGGISVERAFRHTLGFVFLFLAVDILLVLVPDTVLWLPRWLAPQMLGGR
ncbi:MAG: TRAP transporter large permease [candidate division NC10 bacterium]